MPTDGNLTSVGLPWWAHIVSVLLSMVVVPLTGLVVKQWKEIRSIKNGGSGLLDQVADDIKAIETRQGEMSELLARLDERTKHHGESLIQAWAMIDKLSSRHLSVSSHPRSEK